MALQRLLHMPSKQSRATPPAASAWTAGGSSNRAALGCSGLLHRRHQAPRRQLGCHNATGLPLLMPSTTGNTTYFRVDNKGLGHQQAAHHYASGCHGAVRDFA